MKNCRNAICFSVLILCLTEAVTRTYSAVLTFDEMPPAEYSRLENGYGQLQWDNFWIQNATNGVGYHGMVSSPDVAFNGDGGLASLSSSKSFILGSAYLTSAYANGMQVRVQGYEHGFLTHDNTYAIHSSAPTLINFNYSSVDQVTFTPLPSGIFTMDDLSLSISDPNSTGCTFALSSSDQRHGPGTETGAVTVFASEGCIWTISNSIPWVTITSGLTNINNGTVTYALDSNKSGLSRTGVVQIAGQAFTVTQFAAGGTNLADFGRVEVSAIGHTFYDDSEGLANVVIDTLLDQSKTSGGGGVIPAISANFDTVNRFVLSVSAPVGYKIVIHPPVGQGVRFVGAIDWEGTSRSAPALCGVCIVTFNDLEGTAPNFGPSESVLSESHGFFGYHKIESSAFSNDVAFSSLTISATVPSLNIGYGPLDYVPLLDSALLLTYTTIETNDPGGFVSIVPANRPAIQITFEPNGDVTLNFTGTLQSADDLTGTFTDLAGKPEKTYTIPKGSLADRQFFRARY